MTMSIVCLGRELDSYFAGKKVYSGAIPVSE